MKISIYEYVDYTEYIKDWYEQEKVRSQIFSYRVFADRCGFKTKSYIPEVIKGTKKLSKTSICKVAHAMKLDEKEHEFFSMLVYFKNAKTSQEKDFYWEQIQSNKNIPLATQKVFKEFQVLEKWYIIPIREIITVVSFNGNFRYLGNQLIPSITGKQAQQAVELLEDLNMVEKNGELYSQIDFQLVIIPELRNLAVQKFQKMMISLGRDAFENVIRKHRNMKTISFGTNDELDNEIDSIIERCIRDVLAAVEKYPKVERVRQVNIQSFPISKELKVILHRGGNDA